MGKTDMNNVPAEQRDIFEEYIHYPANEVETPFVDTSKDIEYHPHFKDNAWTFGEAYMIHTTMQTCVEWLKLDKNFTTSSIVKKLVNKGLVGFYCGLMNDGKIARFMYMRGVEQMFLEIPLKIYMRGTMEIRPVM